MIEQRFKESIDRYVQKGTPTGGFLRAVLENDLKMAIGTADIGAMANLKFIVQYCYNDIPSGCWGNPEKVRLWIERKGEEYWTKENAKILFSQPPKTEEL